VAPDALEDGGEGARQRFIWMIDHRLAEPLADLGIEIRDLEDHRVRVDARAGRLKPANPLVQSCE
jgi:hypothetical protein